MKHFANKPPKTITNKKFLDNDFVCPVTYKETDLETCKSNCFGEGCSFINTCQAVKTFKDSEGEKVVKTKKRKKEKK